LQYGERVRARLECGTGHLEHAVTVGVGLHREHRAGGRGDRGEGGDVVPEGVQVDAQLAHRASRWMRWPSPAVSASGARSPHAAHSCALGSPRAGSPKTTTSAPGACVSEPRSITSWSMAMRPTSGYRTPSMESAARFEPRR